MKNLSAIFFKENLRFKFSIYFSTCIQSFNKNSTHSKLCDTVVHRNTPFISSFLTVIKDYTYSKFDIFIDMYIHKNSTKILSIMSKSVKPVFRRNN